MKKYDNQWIKDAMNGVTTVKDTENEIRINIIRIKKEKNMYPEWQQDRIEKIRDNKRG